MRRGGPWECRKMDGPVAVQVSTEEDDRTLDLVDVEQETGSEGISTYLTRKPSMASPRLIPVPDSPPLSAQLPPEPLVAKKGPASSSVDRNFASFQGLLIMISY